MLKTQIGWDLQNKVGDLDTQYLFQWELHLVMGFESLVSTAGFILYG